MPLLYQSTTIQATANQETLNHFKHEFKQSSNYLLESVQEHFNAEHVLYVAQHEYAVVLPSDDNVHIMGSEDATTCHIVIIRHTGCGATALGHFDGTDTKNALTKMINMVQIYADESNIDGRLEVHIIGGFKDERGLSLDLSLQIIQTLASSTFNLYLITPCFGEINDTIRSDGVHQPILYGVGIHIESGKIMWASFDNKGPDEILRGARLSWSYCNEMINLYDTSLCELYIQPFQLQKHQTQVYLYFLMMPDEMYLSKMSTSPKVEPKDFVQKSKRIVQFMLSSPNMNEIFPLQMPRRYRSNNGIWTRVVNS